MSTVIEPFLTAAEAAAFVGTGDVVVADVRSYLDGRSGLAAFTGGHVPGASSISLDTELANQTAPAPKVAIRCRARRRSPRR